MDKEVEKVFTPRPMVSFLSAWKLISYLIRAKLYHLERTVGSCQVCNYITEADSFTCSNDQLSFKINHRFDCNEKCLIYLITCHRCLKQYVGQTVDEFRHRLNNYKDNARKFERREQCIQWHLYKHFNLRGHSGFLNDVSVPLNMADPTDTTKPEDFWIQTLKTKAPLGLNVEYGLSV